MIHLFCPNVLHYRDHDAASALATVIGSTAVADACNGSGEVKRARVLAYIRALLGYGVLPVSKRRPWVNGRADRCRVAPARMARIPKGFAQNFGAASVIINLKKPVGPFGVPRIEPHHELLN